MKRKYFVFLTICLFLVTAGCSSQQDKKQTVSENNTEPKTENIEKDSSTKEDANKELVVYFSWSGNTEKVAKEIQKQTDADIVEIQPLEPYSDDYDAVVDLAQQEQSAGARPEIANQIDNISDYDVIYVGFPNWWGDMPMILYTFFDTYDLSDKTISPFCTSGGSGLSNTVNEIKDLEPNALVTDGLHIGESSVSNSDAAVKEWLNSIH